MLKALRLRSVMNDKERIVARGMGPYRIVWHVMLSFQWRCEVYLMIEFVNPGIKAIEQLMTAC
jgi:hypothetical protein